MTARETEIRVLQEMIARTHGCDRQTLLEAVRLISTPATPGPATAKMLEWFRNEIILTPKDLEELQAAFIAEHEPAREKPGHNE